jgi:hypothetical protein
MLGKRYITAVAIALALSVSVHVRDARTAQASLEYEVKAAFLYNFAKFVEWPDNAFASADAPVVFCIVGTNPFDGALERVINDRTAHGRRILVQETAEGTPGACQLVFVSGSEDGRVARVVQTTQAAQGAPVLTVGESQAFNDAGGMIRLVVEEGGVRFDINAAIAERAGLKFSSQLLKLARKVVR